eukprot:gb/GECH01012040.1/.p1 GENE.gb/GECH01012040.1/~~gb/GECH01012040.1/.p1  ORF type:complete len:216 (+),score=47.84 gb/GECH01012040.1/:1-648(+)
MLRSTHVVRKVDGLPLAEGMEEDKEQGNIKSVAKQLMKQIPSMELGHRLSIQSNATNFHILTESGVCFITAADASYPARLAFSYLDELKVEFNSLYGAEVDNVERPYPFVNFDTFIQRTKRVYTDMRSAHNNISGLNEELKDVQDIVQKSLEQVMERGEKLPVLGELSRNMKEQSSKFRTSAKDLNRYYWWRTYYPILVVLAIVGLCLFIRFYFW